MSGKRSAPRNSSVPDYNIALLGEIGVGKSGKSTKTEISILLQYC